MKDLKFSLTTFAVLCLLCVGFRFLPHLTNITPCIALAVLASVSNKYAKYLLLGVYAVGDVLFTGYITHGVLWFYPGCYLIWLSMFLISFLFEKVNIKSPISAMISGVSGSLVWFILSNLVAWLFQALPYGYTFQGLIDCYLMGLPYYKLQPLYDSVYTLGLWSLYYGLKKLYMSRVEYSVA